VTELVFGIEIAGHFDSWHRAATGVSAKGMGLLDTLSRFWPHLASGFHVPAALLASIHALLHKRDSRSGCVAHNRGAFLVILPGIFFRRLFTSIGIDEHGNQPVGFDFTVVARAVYEKCRSAINAGAGAAPNILAHTFVVDSGQDFVDDATRINARSRGVLGKVLVGERVLVFEQEVVHLPKPTLSAGGLGGLSCMGRVSVYVCQREVPEGKTQSIA